MPGRVEIGRPLAAPRCTCVRPTRNGDHCTCGRLLPETRTPTTIVMDADAAQLERKLATATAVLAHIADSPASVRADRQMCRTALARIGAR